MARKEEKLDKETQAVVTQTRHFQDLVKHESWGAVRERFTQQMLDLQSITNIDEADIQKIAVELKARKIAAEFLFEWLRWIEGQAIEAVPMDTITKKSWLVKTD